MRYLILAIGLFLGLASIAGAQDDNDSSFHSVQKIDLGAEGDPTGAPAENHSLIMFNVKKLGVSGANAHIVFYQFPGRVRLEFEGAGLPRGLYALSLGPQCHLSAHSPKWTSLYRFHVTSSNIQTEKSLPKASLKEDAKAKIVLSGHSLGFFKETGGKLTEIDCQNLP